MRINYLRMRNFSPIYYSLDKEEILLDYNGEDIRDKTIFIFVGKMGSCKTFILGHHQPFATLGTVDIRNSEDMILPGKRGIKEMEYEYDGHVYHILHIYAAGPDGKHSLKSYIEKDGAQLNQNGNVHNFHTIIEAEFGLEQNYLKLFRIGSNVVNLPDMSSSERKSFVGSMLSETDIYMVLYKRIGERVRALNAQMNMLLGRLKAISNKDELALEADLRVEEKTLQEINQEYSNIMKEQFRVDAEMKALLGDMTVEQFSEHIQALAKEAKDAEAHYQDLEISLEGSENLPEPTKLAEEIAATRTRCEMRDTAIIRLNKELQESANQLQTVTDKLTLMGSAEQVANLKSSYERLMSQRDEYVGRLKNFTYAGTEASISNLIAEARVIDSMIGVIAQYNRDALQEILHNPQRAINLAKHETDRLLREQTQVQREMSNLSFVGTYSPTHLMVRPPECPTPDCPFYKFHPVTEAKRLKGTKVDQRFLEYKSKLSGIQAKLSHYEIYPQIASRISDLKKQWERIIPIAEPLQLVENDSMADVILNPTNREWFDLSRANHIRELCTIREKYYQLTQQIAAMKDELAVYEMSDREGMEREHNRLTKVTEQQRAQLDDYETQNRQDKRTLETMITQYTTLSNIELVKAEAEEAKSAMFTANHKHKEAKETFKKIMAYRANLASITAELSAKREEFNAMEHTCNGLRRKLADMQYTKTQYDESAVKYGVLKDVMDAVSPKSGIPLAFVRLFLSECRDTINELISNVFADHVEIQDFYIPEDSTEFYIPYTKNGQLIGDVNKASQGERSIINLAISFALITQAGIPYNIPLMDEVDAALYRQDRNELITIILNQARAMNAEQMFFVSHNNIFDGFNVCIIMTTDEVVDESPLTSIIRV